MQSISDMEITENDFLTAEQLREITATPDELFEARVSSIKENAMTTMVRLAREQGRHFYAIQFTKKGNEKLLEAIHQEFEKADYKVTQTETKDKTLTGEEVDITLLTISWEA